MEWMLTSVFEAAQCYWIKKNHAGTLKQTTRQGSAYRLQLRLFWGLLSVLTLKLIFFSLRETASFHVFNCFPKEKTNVCTWLELQYRQRYPLHCLDTIWSYRIWVVCFFNSSVSLMNKQQPYHETIFVLIREKLQTSDKPKVSRQMIKRTVDVASNCQILLQFKGGDTKYPELMLVCAPLVAEIYITEDLLQDLKASVSRCFSQRSRYNRRRQNAASHLLHHIWEKPESAKLPSCKSRSAQESQVQTSFFSSSQMTAVDFVRSKREHKAEEIKAHTLRLALVFTTKYLAD